MLRRGMQNQTINIYCWDLKMNLILADPIVWAMEQTGNMPYSQLQSINILQKAQLFNSIAITQHSKPKLLKL